LQCSAKREIELKADMHNFSVVCHEDDVNENFICDLLSVYKILFLVELIKPTVTLEDLFVGIGGCPP
jgi:hypothetical protein